MRKLFEWMPLQTLIVLTIFLGLVPFLPEPHIWQKAKMLASGTALQTIDVLDVIFHMTPAVLLTIKIILARRN